jgi:hypothetical protein
MKFISYLAFCICVCLAAACGGESANNTRNANSIQNFNVNHNVTANTNTYQTPEANMSNTSTSNINTNMSMTINQDTLSKSLKERLKHDRAELLTEDDWANDKVWLDVNIGPFYKNDDEFVRDVVCDVTNGVLKNNNKRMTQVSQRGLRKKVKSDMKCTDAVKAMLSAALDTEPIQPIL